MSRAQLDHVAARVLGRPLLILPAKLDIIVGVLAGRLGLDHEGLDIAASELGLADRPSPIASRFVGSRRDKDSGAALPYVRTEAGTAIVTVTGSMVNRGAWVGASSGLTSYEGVAAQIRAAIADPKVAALLIDLDTPGGEATGAFELAELVRQANAAKPVTALVNGLAASAGYMMASGAGRIVSVPSGQSGSIGVVMMHADYSRALDRAGITPTLIHSGAHKVEGNPYTPLDADTKARLQAEVDAMREDFVQAVATGRGRRMSAKAARDTEARIFDGKDALAAGLVDALASFDELHADMTRGGARRTPASRRQAAMSDHDRSDHNRTDYTQADLDAAATTARAAGHAAGLEEGRKAGLAEGASAERVRIKAIVEHPEAKGREALAAQYAYGSSMPAAEVEPFLKAAGKTGGLAARVADVMGLHTAGADAAAAKPITIDAGAIYGAMNKRS